MHDRIALFDLDGTLADYHGQLVKDIAEINENYFEFPNQWDNLPEWMERQRTLVTSQPGWWRNLPKFELGFRILNMILHKTDCEIHILTKGPTSKPFAWKEKVEWVQENIDRDVPITITTDKGLVYGKILVDDWPGYIDRWLEWRPRGLVIMPAHPYNEKYKHPNVIRFDGKNMEEVEIRVLQRTQKDGSGCASNLDLII